MKEELQLPPGEDITNLLAPIKYNTHWPTCHGRKWLTLRVT